MRDRFVLVSLSGAYSINPAHVQPEARGLLGGVDPLLTPDEVAAALGMTLATFYRTVRPRLPVVKIDGKSTRFRLSDVVGFAAERVEVITDAR